MMSFLFLVWYGVIFVRMGIYQDGVFRFKLNVPSNYPDGDCPVSYKTWNKYFKGHVS